MAHQTGLESTTFASGVQYHELAFHGLALNRPIKAFIIIEHFKRFALRFCHPLFLLQ